MRQKQADLLSEGEFSEQQTNLASPVFCCECLFRFFAECLFRVGLGGFLKLFSRVFFLFFIFAGVANAQSFVQTQRDSYTSPSDHELDLINDAVAGCDILSQVVESIDGREQTSQEIFDKLQQTDKDGNLLIDNHECGGAILEFVSSMCSSGDSVNDLYCNRLGITKIEDTNEYAAKESYKNFGSSALGDLDLGDRDFVNQNEVEGTKFSIAQALFLLTPVRKLKFIKPASRVLGSNIKPVLSGAMLMLASLGLASCDDLTSPEQVCNSGLSNYFLVKRTPTPGSNSNTSSEDQVGCIRLPDVEVTFTDSAGNLISGTSRGSKAGMHINIQFDTIVSYIDENGRGAKLSKNLDLYDMVEINYEDTLNLVGEFVLLDDFELGVNNGKSYITIKPPALLDGFYPEGSHTIKIKNYVKQKDLSLISSSNNINEYLQVAQEQAAFYSGESKTPCTEGLPGYFQLESDGRKLKCIALPRVVFNYTSGGVTTNQSDGSSDVVIDLEFDSKIVYLGRGNVGGGPFSWEELSLHRLSQMVSVKQYGRELIGNEIGIANLSFGLTSGGNTYIRIMPPAGGYSEGDYEVSVENYAREQDANLIVNSQGFGNSSRTRYLSRTKKYSVFYVGDLETECDRLQIGWFKLELDNSRNRCIRLASATASYTANGATLTPGTAFSNDVVINVQFDSDIVYFDGSNVDTASLNYAFDMVEIKHLSSGGGNLVGDTINLSNFSIGQSGDGTYFIRIISPQDGYDPGDYEVTVKNFVKQSDASLVAGSSNSDEYLQRVQRKFVFFVDEPSNGCTRGEQGWFQLKDADDNNSKCIQYPRVNATPIDVTDVLDKDGVIQINFEGRVAYFGEERVLSGDQYIYRYRWEELSKARVLSDMLDIRTLLGVSLIETGRINSSHITVGSSNGNHYIRINPPDNDYNPGSYEISIEEFARYEDASLIYASSNRDEYAFGANKLFSFSVEGSDCGATGGFQLEDSGGQGTECIKIARPRFSYTNSGTSNVVINISFSDAISYLDGNGNVHGLNSGHLLNMIEIVPFGNGGGGNLIGDTIRLENLSVNSRGDTITINPPIGGYKDGDYSVSIKDYVKTSDASAVASSGNVEDYRQKAQGGHAFFVGTSDNPCTRGESSHFQVKSGDQNVKCIEYPTFEIEFRDTQDNNRLIEQEEGRINIVPSFTEIKIIFDGQISYLGRQGFEELSVHRVPDMIDIRYLENCDDDSKGDYTDCKFSDENIIGRHSGFFSNGRRSGITLDRINVGVDGNGNSYIRIGPPTTATAEGTDGGYNDYNVVGQGHIFFDDYRLELESYVSSDQIPYLRLADDSNLQEYLEDILKHEFFHVDHADR